ncbi:MAG TPA: DUF362 domain-containing protein [Treponemataceae bacterium]|nr:DUF362 domain-containing protein [Treponemataceae bacterium]
MAKSKVAVIRCESYDEDVVYAAVSRGVELLGGIGAFVRKGEKILMKPNVLAGSAPELAVTTHPAVFNAVARILTAADVEVSYGDSPGFGKPLDALAKSGLSQVAERYGIPLADFEHGQSVENPDGFVGKRFDLSNAALETDGIVSLPKMKTHALTRVTGAVKNQFGCVYGLNKAAFHVRVPNQVLFSKMLIDLNLMLKTRLFVMDGIMAMEGNGPRGGTPVAMNCLIISSDPIAVDSTFCRMIDLDPTFIPTITHGAERGLGKYEVSDIEYLGDDPASFRKPDFDAVRKPVTETNVTGLGAGPAFLQNAIYPRPVIDPAICVKCGVCVESCPVEGKAVNFRNGNRKSPPEYTYSKCIRCYCCQEMCPYKAISVKRPWLGRLLSRS